MNRLGVTLFVGAAFLVAACGSTATASNSSPSPSARGARGGGVAGQLVQINGDTLIVTGANGDTTVTITSTTPILKTSIATLADIVPGECIVATGTKDTSGQLTANMVRLAPKGANGCTAAVGFGPPGTGSPRPSLSPRPSFSPRPTPSGQPALNAVVGEVTAANGTSITVKTATGSQTITVPTVASVMVSATVTAADLQVNECVRATGAPDSSGAIQATSLTITPPGANGMCSTAIGRGRPGGGGFGG